MTERDRQLLDVAREARRWFANDLAGNAQNGPSDAIFLARSLTRIVALFDDEPAVSDRDRREQAAWAVVLLEGRR